MIDGDDGVLSVSKIIVIPENSIHLRKKNLPAFEAIIVYKCYKLIHNW